MILVRAGKWLTNSPILSCLRFVPSLLELKAGKTLLILVRIVSIGYKTRVILSTVRHLMTRSQEPSAIDPCESVFWLARTALEAWCGEVRGYLSYSPWKCGWSFSRLSAHCHNLLNGVKNFDGGLKRKQNKTFRNTMFWLKSLWSKGLYDFVVQTNAQD